MTGTPGPNHSASPTERLEIERIVAGGDGLARRPEGPVVFVPRTAPGERVEVEVVERRRQWARAWPLRILRAAPERRAAPCHYYDTCGGCQLQHLDYRAQLVAKAGIVAENLRRLGGLEVDPPDVTPSPAQLEYRNRVTFVLRRGRDGVAAGFHGFEKPTDIVDIPSCPLAEPPINRAWSALRSAWGPNASRLPAGAELRLTLRATSQASVGLAIEGGLGRGEPEALLEAVDLLEAVWGIDRGGAVEWFVGRAALEERWGDHRVNLAGLQFVQVNREMAMALEAYVHERCGDPGGQRVVDAYCGFGVRALELAQRGARVVGIDSDAGAIEYAERGAVALGLAARFVAAPVERALSEELPADLVILNPPRRGVADPVVRALLGQPPSRIIYVSCDPATLSRDLKALAPGFDLIDLQAFDMFPQTAQVEVVASLWAEAQASRPTRRHALESHEQLDGLDVVLPA